MSSDEIERLLSTFISYPSISADPTRRGVMSIATTFLAEKLKKLSFDVQLLGEKSSIQTMYATRYVPNAHHTIGIYGHYDVQPVDPLEEWNSDPFTLTKRDGKYFGRGVADNKGHIIQNIAAIEMLIESGKLTNNIVFLIEGEEETGSNSLEKQLSDKREELKDIDVWYVTDSGMFSKNVPQIEYALRGLVYFELTITTGERDLHSGLYGNTAYNPVNILASLFARMKDGETGEILIDGFYNDARAPDAFELKLLESTMISDDLLMKEMNVYAVSKMKGVPAYLASKIRPSLDIHGIQSGFTGEGPKTVIPRVAQTKFSFRLVENQDPKIIEQLVRAFIEKHLPEGVKYELKILSSDHPFYSSFENEYIKNTASIFSKHFGNTTVFNRSGGSIPVAEMIQRILKKPVVITGFTLPDDNIHAPNENFDEEMFWSGIEALKKVYGA